MDYDNSYTFLAVLGIFYVAWVIRKLALAEKIHPAAAVSAVPVAVVTGSHEQYAVIMTLLLVLSGVYLWKAHRRPGNAVLFWTLAVIDVVSLLVIALCPGMPDAMRSVLRIFRFMRRLDSDRSCIWDF